MNNGVEQAIQDAFVDVVRYQHIRHSASIENGRAHANQRRKIVRSAGILVASAVLTTGVVAGGMKLTEGSRHTYGEDIPVSDEYDVVTDCDFSPLAEDNPFVKIEEAQTCKREHSVAIPGLTDTGS